MLPDHDFKRTYDRKKGSNIVQDFYVPALSEAISYDRLTFSFTSGALAAAATGFAGLIRNGGRMRILAAPELTPADKLALTTTASSSEFDEKVSRILEEKVDSLVELASSIHAEYVSALAWLFKMGRLELKFAIPNDLDIEGNGIFHTKLGIIRDSVGNALSFSGSINESYSAWRLNNERFKVFKNWDERDLEDFRDDEDSFNEYWNNPELSGIRNIEVSEAISRKLVSTASDSEPSERIASLERHLELPAHGKAETKKLRGYQLEAVDSWVAQGYRGILAMATGSGKTFTSKYAVETLEKVYPNLVTVVLSPSVTIATQWAGVLANRNPLFLNQETRWTQALNRAVNSRLIDESQPLTIVSTMHRAAAEKFLNTVRKLRRSGAPLLLVADEVHHFGAKAIRNALSDDFDFRLGLSATPSRYFDDEGSRVISDYFAGTCYEYTIGQALAYAPEPGENPILSPFTYKPVLVQLDGDELAEYRRLSKALYNHISGSEELSETGESIARKRALILKLATAKIPALENELRTRGQISRAIIYCQNSRQVEEVMALLLKLGIKPREFSGKTKANPKKEYGGLSERDWAIKDLEEGNIDALVAMKILDEGVDIPSARLGFILASSGNVKEFVQRTGRLIRWHKDKGQAEIVDFVVSPSAAELGFDPKEQREEARIVKKEFSRILTYAAAALNFVAVETILFRIIEKLSIGGESGESFEAR